jgi:hypothetical protein
MSSPTPDPVEEYARLRRDLEQQVRLLKAATSRDDRIHLLRGLRLMLKKADQLISAEE